MREFARTLWQAAAMRGMALSGASLGERLRSLGPSAAVRVGAVLLAALLATAALFAATGLRSGAWPASTSLLALPQGRILPPADNRNFGWLERAIAQCEQEAARSADTLYFLVIPVVATDGNPQPWIPKSNGTVGPVLLIGS